MPKAKGKRGVSPSLWTAEPWYSDGVLVGFMARSSLRTEPMRRWACNPADGRSILEAVRAAHAYCNRMNISGGTGPAEVVPLPKAKGA